MLKRLPNLSDENGCYICNCSPNGPYLHWVTSQDGFPTSDDKDYCPLCNNKIKYEWFLSKKTTMREREGYFRVFKDDDSLRIARENINQCEGNFETLDSFWEKFINQNLRKEKKGIISISENHFLKDSKCIRKLSQISYRLLNYILFSNLLFASALGYIDRNQLKLYGAMNVSCIRIIEKNWELLKIELIKVGVDNIEIFMNIIFEDLSNALIQIKEIYTYEKLL